MENNNNMLAKLSLGINVILIIAVIVLFVKMPSGSETADSDGADSLDTSVEVVNDGEMTIAYYSGDSLNSTTFFVDLQAEMQKSQSDAETKLMNKQKSIERWQEGWNEKAQTGLMPREQEQYAQEAQQKEQELMMFQQQVQMEAAQSQEQLMMTMYGRINLYSKSFCEKNNIDVLLQSQLGNNISYVAPHMDVTKQFVNHVNNEYGGTTVDVEDGEDEGE
jgi:outer membrane protein